MMSGFVKFLKDWMLPMAIVSGVSVYLIFHFVHFLHPIGPVCGEIATKSQQLFVAVMLFLQFVKVPPKSLRLRKWHVILLSFQALTFIGLAVAATLVKSLELKILLESAMLCFICPTASASGVITDKLGGSLAEDMSYIVLINAMATVLIPTVIPFVHPAEGMNFLGGVWKIASKIFPVLLLPSVLAWIIRYTCPRLQAWLSQFTNWAFYIWGLSLTFAMVLATRSLVWSGLGWLTLLLIGVVSIACCLIQFGFGHYSGRKYGKTEEITAGQSLGQKNTGFLIWLGYSFLTPVTSIAGGFYSIAHNLVNSWELYEKRKK